jgi:SAM-dependent methyltransferase
MSFQVAAESYDRFMGRFSRPLAVLFADAVGVRRGRRALDVGCGPGALTAELVERLGADAVCGIDPSPPFVEAARQRFPGLDVRLGSAEDLPFEDDSFDATLAQLVVQFMRDPVRGLAEMGRVTVPGGLVAASVWDHSGEGGPLSAFWAGVKAVDPAASDEGRRSGVRPGHLVRLFADAGLGRAEETTLTVLVGFPTFQDWWEPFTFGVGPAGAYLAGLDDATREAVRRRCEELLPPAPFQISASAWCVQARA